jgi:Amt family ammonium transporter
MSVQIAIDTVWLTTATFLVLMMQAGFLLLEGGRVRAKNSINVAQKNLSDLVVSWAGFFIIGFAVMFGTGVPDANGEAPPGALQFLYQLGFCATAASIVSGAIAERMSYRGYLVMAAVISILVYPLVGRAVWGDMFIAEHTAWLADLGFVDFAGSTVVHCVGAWAGLVGILLIGARHGRYDEDGKLISMPANNTVISMVGVLLLLLGWLGFNGGSTSPGDPVLASILLNTMTAACFGALAGMAIGVRLDNGVFNPSRICNGLLGGLVACTASVNLMSTADAMWVGLAGGGVATAGAEWLARKLKIDDPVDVVATHGFAGLLGTLMVAFVAPVEALPTGSVIAQFGVQLLGATAVFVFVSSVTWLSLKIASRWIPLRVTEQEEKLGLNYTEHGEAVGAGRLQMALESRIQDATGFAGHIDVASNDEHSELAQAMNQLLDKHEKARLTINQSEQRFKQFAQTASDWLWETDSRMVFTYISECTGDLPDLHSLSRNQSLFDFFAIDEADENEIRLCLHHCAPLPMFESRVDSADNLLVEVRGVPFFDESGDLLGYRGTVSDISPRKAAENRALYLATHDELTGLPNRRALDEQLDEALESCDRSGLALVVAGIDLDGFKKVNDSYGHSAGDELLREVASRIESELRPQDRAFRTGGDEFVVLLTGLHEDTALAESHTLGNRLIESVSKDYVLQSATTRIGASIGLAAHPLHNEKSTDLARLADLALYAAKSQGKGRVITFDPQMDLDYQRQHELEVDLRQALARDQFFLLYQPLIDTATEQVIGFEALIRWQHPERGLIPPDQFIGLAEQLDLMDDIGAYVLRTACEFAAQWMPTSTAPRIAVNVSPTQLKSAGFVPLVRQTLADTGLDPDRLELEITEDVLVHNFSEMRETLLQVRAMGVSVAVDDFGSGRTSLRYLNQFPVSKLKIDRAFVRHLGNDGKAAQITQSIVNLAQRLGVTVIAEGVEEQQHLEMLRQWQCDQVQGYLFSKPVSADNVLEMLKIQQSGSDQSKAG